MKCGKSHPEGKEMVEARTAGDGPNALHLGQKVTV